MPGETDLHKTLKKEACRWLYRVGYRCIAAEVRLPPLGIVDAVGTGVFGAWQNHLNLPKVMPQVCFVECKASRSDFLRDVSHDGQLSLCLGERSMRLRTRRRRGGARWRARHAVGLGKFDSCLMLPMANIHYVLAPAGVVQKKDLPARWGLLSYGDSGVTVVHKAEWQEESNTSYVESQIARTLTCDIYNADRRAMNSVNREVMAQQQHLAARIRAARPVVVGM